MDLKEFDKIKIIDVIATALLIIGGLNWGLVGLFGIDLVAGLFGDMTVLTQLVYLLVGISAFYEALTWKLIQRRWECRIQFRKTEHAAV